MVPTVPFVLTVSLSLAIPFPKREAVAMDATVAGPTRMALRGGTLEHRESGRVVEIGDGAVTIGRGSSCDLQLDDRQISTAHCRFLATDLGALVEDLGSRNGTFVGKARLRAHSAVYLREPAELRVGRTTLLFAPRELSRRELPASFGCLESRSPRMRQVLAHLLKIAPLPTAVLITGESGTGKEYVARALHAASPRASKPFVVIDCASIAPSLIESTLFGHEKGAFTGATTKRVSPFMDANGGTVFLDEIGELPPEAQARLLRLVAEKEFQSVGQNRYTKVDVRVLSATLRDLADAVNTRKFREDLYHRLSQTRVELPPLRDRLEDVEILARRALVDMGRLDVARELTESTVEQLSRFTWTGNVRQLKDVLTIAAARWEKSQTLDVEEAYTLSGGARGLSSSSLRAKVPSNVFDALTTRGTRLEDVMADARRIVLSVLYKRARGSVSEVARLAGVSRRHAREQLEVLGIRAPERRAQNFEDDE